ncbi:MAG: hypothetical protein AAGA66_18320, partial [Bacteroidota bacterium]
FKELDILPSLKKVSEEKIGLDQIIPEKIMVIGNFDCDVPICLDLRYQGSAPVIYLKNNYWVQIAPSYNVFISLMKI